MTEKAEEPGLCGNCFKALENPLVCARCKTSSYCSKHCQIKAWKAGYKLECKPVALADIGTEAKTGLRAVGQVKGWQTQQIVFVGGTCGSVHVESFNKNMKALGVLESKWNPIRQKLVLLLLEEQDKVLRSYFAQKGGTRGQRGGGSHGQGREHVKWDMYV